MNTFGEINPLQLDFFWDQNKINLGISLALPKYFFCLTVSICGLC